MELTREQQAAVDARAGNVTLHPDDALRRCDNFNVITAPERNAAHC